MNTVYLGVTGSTEDHNNQQYRKATASLLFIIQSLKHIRSGAAISVGRVN